MIRQPALHQLERKRTFTPFYLASFLAAFHFFVVVFINSSFLKTYVGEELVGVFYVISAVISVLIFLSVSHFLARLGNYRALIVFTSIEALALLGIAFIPIREIAVLLFVTHLAVAPVIFYCLDVFLESSMCSEETTGRVRGLMLTLFTAAIIVAPLVSGSLVEAGGFAPVYALATAVLVPFIALIALQFKRFVDPPYRTMTPRTAVPALRELWNNCNIRNVVMAHLVMRLFMAWMAVYLPIYLHDHIGFSWAEIGVMLVLIFLPYFVEFPLGNLADTRWGEKEMLVIGFILIAGATFFIPFITTANFALWTALLFVSRLGTAFTEIMSESYFFKQIRGDDTELLSFFRLLRPLAYIFSISIAVISLTFVDLRYTFFVLAALMLLGVHYGLMIRDTR